MTMFSVLKRRQEERILLPRLHGGEEVDDERARLLGVFESFPTLRAERKRLHSLRWIKAWEPEPGEVHAPLRVAGNDEGLLLKEKTSLEEMHEAAEDTIVLVGAVESLLEELEPGETRLTKVEDGSEDCLNDHLVDFRDVLVLDVPGVDRSISTEATLLTEPLLQCQFSLKLLDESVKDI